MTSHIKLLPPPAEHIREAYRQLVTDIDELAEKLVTTRFSHVLQCRPGCDECCMRFSVLPLEAAIIVEAIQSVPLAEQADNEKCMLLYGGFCQVYDVRPIICRTQGLPLGYVDEEKGIIEVSACQLNFAADYPLDSDDLLYMDAFNRRLAELNLEYCQVVKIEPQQRLPFNTLAS